MSIYEEFLLLVFIESEYISNSLILEEGERKYLKSRRLDLREKILQEVLNGTFQSS